VAPAAAGGGLFTPARQRLESVVSWLAGPLAGGLDHGGLEERLAGDGRELARLLLQAHLDLRAAREERRAGVTGADGMARTRAERGHRRRLATVAGPVTVSRIACRAPGAANVHPADAQLNLPPEMHSHGLRKRAAAEAARGSFGQARAAVAGATGVRLGKRQVQELTRRAAADFAAFYADARYRPPPGAGAGDVLALSCDAKGIIVVPGALRPEAARKARQPGRRQDGRLSRGEVAHRKRMAETGAVFDVTPAPRTARDIMHRPGPGPAPPPAPLASNKWVTASITGDAAEVVAAVFAEAGRRDPRRQRTWIALADGNIHQIDRIRAEAAARGLPITIVCDFIHVIEYLRKAAWCLFPEASPHAGPWVRARAAAILRGHARPVAAAIRARISAAGDQLSPARRRQATAAAGYLDAKAPWLDYPTALAAGWPISAGVIEGTCRYLVKDRLDITGARWGLDDAEAILKIRALLANDDYDAYWPYHLQQEHQRNHPESYDLAA